MTIHGYRLKLNMTRGGDTVKDKCGHIFKLNSGKNLTYIVSFCNFSVLKPTQERGTRVGLRTFLTQRTQRGCGFERRFRFRAAVV